jgi:hypothetical protein
MAPLSHFQELSLCSWVLFCRFVYSWTSFQASFFWYFPDPPNFCCTGTLCSKT